MKPVKFTDAQAASIFKDMEALTKPADDKWFRAAFTLVVAIVAVLVARNSDLIIAMVHAPTS